MEKANYNTDLRFNPAYAGNILRLFVHFLVQQVQPRVCGEYVRPLGGIVDLLGSTPRMRGILLCLNLVSRYIRFNPAYAGNIVLLVLHSFLFQVQPRVCGEYKPTSISSLYDTGSTPRMRGIFINHKQLNHSIRFNPAYAGNISASDVELTRA